MAFSITPVDQKPYGDSDFYKRTIIRLDSVREVLAHQPLGEVRIGWGKANITPYKPVRLTGKNWKPFQQVFDSVYVRTFVFSNGHQKIALLSYDLWIMHPHLANAVRERVEQSDLGITGIYFTANHSHTSIGGWGTGLLGNLIIGGNNRKTVDFLVDQSIMALQTANKLLAPAKMGYGEAATQGLVMNRLDTAAKLDSKLRFVKIQQSNGKQAVFSTFSAHSVYMDKDINTLSADYPGDYLAKLEDMKGIDFASFAPGATGSHTPIGRKPFSREKMDAYAEKLSQSLAGTYDQVTPDSVQQLKFVQWPVDIRSPHFRISNHWRFRPWLFHAVMGQSKATITALRVGDIVFVGLPVELSGEFYDDFQKACASRGLKLIITTFNGTYLGYVNPERYYYSLRRAETREMNWSGPQGGEYYVDLINRLLTII